MDVSCNTNPAREGDAPPIPAKPASRLSHMGLGPVPRSPGQIAGTQRPLPSRQLSGRLATPPVSADADGMGAIPTAPTPRGEPLSARSAGGSPATEPHADAGSSRPATSKAQHAREADAEQRPHASGFAGQRAPDLSGSTSLQALWTAPIVDEEIGEPQAETAPECSLPQDVGTPPASLFLTLEELSAAAMEPAKPVIGPIESGQVTVVVGAPGRGKSNILTGWSVGVASGKDVFGMTVPEAAPVVVVMPEDAPRILGLRSIAMARSIGADPALLAKNLHTFNCEAGTKFYQQIGGQHRFSPLGARLFETTKALGAKLLVIDPLIEWHNRNENDNQQMHEVMADVRRFAAEADLAVVIAHHPAKADGVVTLASLRGAGAIAGAARGVFTVNPVASEDAKNLGIGETDHDDLIKLTAEKLSYHPQFRASRSICGAPASRSGMRPRRYW